MRKTFRYKNNYNYWHERWDKIGVDESMVNQNAYPLKFAHLLIKNDKHNYILEAGCGNGRLLRYYHERNFKVVGIDFIQVAVDKIKKADKSIKVIQGDIFDTPFPDQKFKYVLAFGLYHNIENDVKRALLETNRIMTKGGLICASFRADNIQNRIIDSLFLKRFKGDKSKKYFHKSNYKKSELKKLFESANFSVSKIETSTNMPFLFKFKILRGKNFFDEEDGRKNGYKLNFFGTLINSFLMKYLPDQFCNLYIVYGEKA